jgi:dTDP-4-dehydrorhamnose 3,5-epimerase
VLLPQVETLPLAGVLHVTPVRHGDARGYFSETYNQGVFREIGVKAAFMQDNHSRSRERGTIRGLHFQIAPFAQAKLVRVLRGAAYDVAVDLRHGSPTFGQSVGVELSAERGNQLFVPAGFAHGYCTLESDTEVFYKVDAPYSREHERGLLWNDPALKIAWPVTENEAIIIERDRNLPPLNKLPDYFAQEEMAGE